MSDDGNELKLRNDYVDAKPRDVDWSDAIGEDTEGFQAWEMVECDGCKRDVVVDMSSRGCPHNDLVPQIEEDQEDEDTALTDNECDAEIGEGFEGPMMNYFYPCDWACANNLPTEEAAKRIKHLPLCLVEFRDGTRGLALTGGGMDLSTEICLAYVALGFLPPVHFCNRLPRMAGVKKTPEIEVLICAAKRSFELQILWAQRGLEDLTNYEEFLAKG